MDVGGERKRRVKDDAKVFHLRHKKDGVDICCHEEDCGRSRCGGEDQKFSFGHIKFEISIRYSSTDVEEAEEDMSMRPQFKRDIWVGNIHLGSISI